MTRIAVVNNVIDVPKLLLEISLMYKLRLFLQGKMNRPRDMNHLTREW